MIGVVFYLLPGALRVGNVKDWKTDDEQLKRTLEKNRERKRTMTWKEDRHRAVCSRAVGSGSAVVWLSRMEYREAGMTGSRQILCSGFYYGTGSSSFLCQFSFGGGISEGRIAHLLSGMDPMRFFFPFLLNLIIIERQVRDRI